MPLPGQVERAKAGIMTRNTAFVLKGYPRLSETFIAQEILGLERAGLPLEIISLRAPTDKRVIRFMTRFPRASPICPNT
jgi:hypothetical protein